MSYAEPADLRVAELPDVPELVAVVEAAYRGPADAMAWTTEAHLVGGQRVDATMVSAAITAPGSLVLVAPRRGPIQACAQLERRDGYAYFGMFAVAPAAQGGGLGRAVLAGAERYARDQWGAGELRLSVIAQREDLVAWYVRRGFARTGELAPFPYGDERFGIPLRDDLAFETLVKKLG